MTIAKRKQQHARYVVAEADSRDGDEGVVESFSVCPVLDQLEHGGRDETVHHGADGDADDHSDDLVDHPAATGRRLLTALGGVGASNGPRHASRKQAVDVAALSDAEVSQQNEKQWNADHSERDRKSEASACFRRHIAITYNTRRPASADRTARRQSQATANQ